MKLVMYKSVMDGNITGFMKSYLGGQASLGCRSY